MNNRFPQGGGVKTTVVAFLFMFNFPFCRQGAEQLPGSEVVRNFRRKIADFTQGTFRQSGVPHQLPAEVGGHEHVG